MKVRWLAALALVAAVGCGGCDRTEQVPCHFATDADGTRRMTCPDGTSATFPPPVVAPRAGAVSGSASRFGDPRRDGIDVYLALAPDEPHGQPQILYLPTDEQGRFRFEHVPPGVHQVSIASPGFATQSRPVVVDPGEFVLEPVTLRRGVESLACANTDLFASPRRDGFVARYGDGAFRRLVYWQPGGVGMVALAQRGAARETRPYFDASGARVHVLDYPEDGDGDTGNLIRYEVDTGRRLLVADRVQSWAPALDGDALVFLGGGVLRAWNERFDGGSGPVRTLGSDVLYFDVGPRGRLVQFVIGNLLVLWDMEDMTGEALGHASDLARFSPDGSVALVDLGSGLVAWDADGPRMIPIGSGSPDDVSFHDSGRRFVALVTNGASQRLLHVDLDRGGAPQTIRERALTAAYGPGDGGIAWVQPGATGHELYLAASPDATPELLGSGTAIDSLTWSRDGRRLYFNILDSSGTDRLEVYEAGVGAHTLETSVVGPPMLEPDGAGVFFFSVVAGDEVALHHWDPATDATVSVLDAVDPWYATQLPALAGPGSRLIVPDLEGTWYRWDPATATTVPIGHNAEPIPEFAFLADGGLAFVADGGTLWLLAPDATAPRAAGNGLPYSGGALFGASPDGRRFSYLRASPWASTGSLVLFDRAADLAIPLDDDVTTAVQGDRFVAYVKSFPIDPDHPQRLYLVDYPVDER
jgi:hypothetical protein